MKALPVLGVFVHFCSVSALQTVTLLQPICSITFHLQTAQIFLAIVLNMRIFNLELFAVMHLSGLQFKMSDVAQTSDKQIQIFTGSRVCVSVHAGRLSTGAFVTQRLFCLWNGRPVANEELKIRLDLKDKAK